MTSTRLKIASWLLFLLGTMCAWAHFWNSEQTNKRFDPLFLKLVAIFAFLIGTLAALKAFHISNPLTARPTRASARKQTLLLVGLLGYALMLATAAPVSVPKFRSFVAKANAPACAEIADESVSQSADYKRGIVEELAVLIFWCLAWIAFPWFIATGLSNHDLKFEACMIWLSIAVLGLVLCSALSPNEVRAKSRCSDCPAK